ncbi:LysR family transcriptional regulator [Shewanella kaireitica]|uniref:LysR family transcriptional regulator n=1 Tax=Shewanella kaireitica TaxID=212021 RepID=UPI00200C161E|nr:LysR family transcriptional regulator [Shewanella kaireitica]MCL1094771.1 LysR family transcriptional regulator [Shewanella kaireitica]
MKHSDYSLIPTFVAIFEEKNFTKAAKRLGITQSAVSQSVNRLRVIFEDTLFIRGSHGITPTPLAIDVYPTLASSVESIAYMLPVHKNFIPAECERRFGISALSVFGFTLLPELSTLMSSEAPLASVKIEPLLGRDMTNELRAQQCDLVIEVMTNQRSNLRSKVIMQDSLQLLCRTDHPRLTGDSITIDEFLNEKHVTHSQFDKNDAYLIGRGLQGEGILGQRNVAWQASSIMEMLPVIMRTDYIGLLPKTAVAQYTQIHNLKPLETPFLTDPIEVAMFWHSSRTNDPSHRWFRGLCAKAASLYTR